MKGRLARQVEALLRGRWRHLLGPVRARRPVLGARTTARPAGRPGSPDPRWEGPLPWPTLRWLLRVEPGLLGWSGSLESQTWPLSVSTGSDLAAWLAGDGWAIPGTDPVVRTHWVGQMEYVPGTGLAWPDDPPLTELSGGRYHSGLYTSAAALGAVLDPAKAGAWLAYPAGDYRGGAKAMAEACLASGRTLRSRLPGGCSAAPERLGLVWAPTGEIWALDASAAGLLAWPMIVSDATVQVWDWWRAGTITPPIAAHLALLHVLADLTPTAGASPRELLSASALAGCYANGAAALWGGWQWLWQAGPASPAGAVQTLCWGPESDGRRRARTCSIALTWAGGVPSASVSVGATVSWGNPGVCPIRIPAGAGHPLPASTEGTSDCVVYTTTCPNGTISLVRQGARASGSWTGSQDYWPGAVLGSETWTGRSESGSRLGRAGWRITGAVAADATSVGLSTVSRTDYLTTPSGFHTETRSSTQTCDVAASGSGYFDCGLSGSHAYCWYSNWYVQCRGQTVSLDLCTRVSTYEYSTRSGGDWAACAAISSGGMIAVGEIQTWGAYTRSGSRWEAPNMAVESRYSGGISTYWATSGQSIPAGSVRWAHNRTGGASAGISGCSGTPGASGSTAPFLYDAARTDFAAVVPAGAEYRRLWLAGGDGTLHVLDAAAWGGLWAPTGETALPADMASYRGSDLWAATPGADGRTSDAGLDAAALAGAQSWAGG